MPLTAGPIHNFGESADALRAHLRKAGGMQPGALTGGAFKVSQNTTANLSVSIATGWALVGSGNGLYAVSSDATTTSLSGGAVGHATLPRIDCVVLKVNDRTDLASTVDGAQLLIRTGTATVGATLDNPVGAATTGPGELLLAHLLMPASPAATYITGNIRDRRPYATGAKTAITGNQAGNITTTSTTDVGAANHTNPRIEVTAGNVVKATGQTSIAVTGGTVLNRVRMSGPSTLYTLYSSTTGTNSQSTPIVGFPFNQNTAGSYACTLLWASNLGGTATMQNNTTFASFILLEEIIGGFQENN